MIGTRALLVLSATLALPPFLPSLRGQTNDFDRFFTVGLDVATAPARFNQRDWTVFGGTLALTGAAFLADAPVRDFAQSNQTPALDYVFWIDKYYVEALGAAALGIYAYGLAAEDDETRLLGLGMGETIVWSDVVTQAVKFTVGRRRPFVADHPFQAEPFNGGFEHRSFPSGHTTFSFAVGAYLAAERDEGWWKAVWFGQAALVGAARIYNNWHWLSDVILGAAIGWATGELVANEKRARLAGDEDVPSPNPLSTPMLTLSVGF
ncbi:MAG: phosphatase PAP2 family protein [Ignavibacteriales bacterium]|nr:phosphatase PAP2 family protein [Ignavibacteriales bacterium]